MRGRSSAELLPLVEHKSDRGPLLAPSIQDPTPLPALSEHQPQ